MTSAAAQSIAGNRQSGSAANIISFKNAKPKTAGTPTAEAPRAETGTLATHVLVSVTEHQEQRQEVMGAITALNRNVAGLVRRVKKLEETVAVTRVAIPATINTLAHFGLKVKKPIPVVIEGDGEDFIASFLDANVSASGDNVQEAFQNLCDILAAEYTLFESLPDDRLGREPKRQFSVLREFVSRG